MILKKRIDIWADTANSVEGTQETVIQFVKRHEDSLLKGYDVVLRWKLYDCSNEIIYEY